MRKLSPARPQSIGRDCAGDVHASIAGITTRFRCMWRRTSKFASAYSCIAVTSWPSARRPSDEVGAHVVSWYVGVNSAQQMLRQGRWMGLAGARCSAQVPAELFSRWPSATLQLQLKPVTQRRRRVPLSQSASQIYISNFYPSSWPDTALYRWHNEFRSRSRR
jgi:hypothetical protein